MSDDPNPSIALIQECEAAIIRIRAAIRAGNGHAPNVGDDFMAIWNAITPRLARFARRVRDLAPEAEDEAMDVMFDQLQKHVWSLTYVSLETGFGKYLQHMPLRAIQTVTRKHGVTDVSPFVARLDAVNEDGLALHETIADNSADAAFAAVEHNEDLYAAIARLPDAERHVITMRLAEVDNNEIARWLGISAPSASRIYHRALTLLRQWLNGNEE